MPGSRGLFSFWPAAAVLFFSPAPPLVAAQETPGPLALAAAGPGLSDILWALGAFALILVALFLALKALRRAGRFGAARGGGPIFEIRGLQPLDNRKYLAAVAVDGRLLIVGVTPDRLTALGQWPLRGEAGEGGAGRDHADSGRKFNPPPEDDYAGHQFKPPPEDGPPDISVIGVSGDGEILK